jgi:hypothetical protein
MPYGKEVFTGYMIDSGCVARAGGRESFFMLLPAAWEVQILNLKNDGSCGYHFGMKKPYDI